MAEWIFKWMDPKIPLLERVIAFACVEGIFFQSAFAAIYWIKKRNILDGLTKANEWIARDERIHVDFAKSLYSTLVNGYKFEALTPKRLNQIVDEAVEIVSDFTNNSLKPTLIGLSSLELIKYVEHNAWLLCTSLGYPSSFKEGHNLDFMVAIALTNKSNFFEVPVSEYKTFSVQCENGKPKTDNYSYELSEDF